jgi:hypothetical protein
MIIPTSGHPRKTVHLSGAVLRADALRLLNRQINTA